MARVEYSVNNCANLEFPLHEEVGLFANRLAMVVLLKSGRILLLLESLANESVEELQRRDWYYRDHRKLWQVRTVFRNVDNSGWRFCNMQSNFTYPTHCELIRMIDKCYDVWLTQHVILGDVSENKWSV